MKSELLLLLHITDKKIINKIELIYLDKKNNILKISNKVSYNKYYRVQKIKDKEEKNLDDILKKTEKIIVKVILDKRLGILTVIPKLSYDEKNIIATPIILIPITSKYIFKYFKEKGREKEPEYIESYNPEEYSNNNFEKKYSIGIIDKKRKETSLHISETNMSADEVIETKNYYDFLTDERDVELFELYKWKKRQKNQDCSEYTKRKYRTDDTD